MGLYMYTAVSKTVKKDEQSKKWIAHLILGMGILIAGKASALTFDIPADGNIVGTIKTATVRGNDTLSTVGRRYDIGGYEMKEANPGVNYLFPEPGSRLTIPTRFILPSGERKGIVVNLAEMRLYFYHPNGRTVSTYPIGIGKQGWLTPLGKTQVVRMQKDPWWIVPDSILEKHARSGKPIPAKMPPGPKNPLGKYKMNLGFKNIVIHGTPYPKGVGLRSSHGCMRMLPEDIQELFGQVTVGMQVRVVHEPHKVGIVGGNIYLEAHVPLRESIYQNPMSINQLVMKTAATYGYQGKFNVRWNDARNYSKVANGYPQRIGNLH